MASLLHITVLRARATSLRMLASSNQSSQTMIAVAVVRTNETVRSALASTARPSATPSCRHVHCNNRRRVGVRTKPSALVASTLALFPPAADPIVGALIIEGYAATHSCRLAPVTSTPVG